jgi:hypothetical protein
MDFRDRLHLAPVGVGGLDHRQEERHLRISWGKRE